MKGLTPVLGTTCGIRMYMLHRNQGRVAPCESPMFRSSVRRLEKARGG